MNSNNPIANLTWPLGWQDKAPQIEQSLYARLPRGYAMELIRAQQRLARHLPPRLEEIGSQHIAELMASPCCFGNQRVALSHLCLALIEMGVWGREMLPSNTGRDLLVRWLNPGWRQFLSKLAEKMRADAVPKDCFDAWMKMATTFLWWAKFPEDQKLEAEEIRAAWKRFESFPSNWSRVEAKRSKRRSRGFSVLWNFAIESNLIQAEPLHEERFTATFWRSLQEPLRLRLHKRYPLVFGASGDQETHFHLLRYAFLLVGFFNAMPVKSWQITEEDFTMLEQRLARERFSTESISKAIADIREVVSAEGTHDQI